MSAVIGDRFSPTVFAPMGDHSDFTKANGGDGSLLVQFYMGAVMNEAKTIEAGREIWDDVEFIRVVIPGDRNNVYDQPASAAYKQRFREQYAAFKAGLKDDEQISGTRLSDWPFLTKGQCEEMRYLGIRTVEQLADVRDDIVLRHPGLMGLKKHANAWLQKSKSAAESAKTQALIDSQANRIDTLEQAIREQSARIEALLKEQKKA